MAVDTRVFEHRRKISSRVKLPISTRVSPGAVREVPVVDQAISSLENHCFCSLDSSWFNKLVKEYEMGIYQGEYEAVVRRIREKWEAAGRPAGLFIVRACELGLCREGMKETKR
jgi:hypothetical protein